MTRSKAIRAKCLECCAGNRRAVLFCPVVKCPLFPYRLGRLVRPSKIYPPEIQHVAAARMDPDPKGGDVDV